MICLKCGGETQAPAGRCHHCDNPVPGDPGQDTTADGRAVDPAEAETVLPSHASHQLSSDVASDAAPTVVLRKRPHGHTATGATLALGQPFGARYRIDRRIGAGGMGAVYEAFDRELGENVALKVIRPEVMERAGAARALERRFKRELLLARRVTHKNVVRIHDIGEVNGIKYITMPYIEGADLATVLKREKRLAVRRAVRIARSIVSGLVAAHEAGIVHRDLKPANIMIDQHDDAFIMDFGIARFAGSDAPEDTRDGGSAHGTRRQPAYLDGLTMPGAIVGTPAYMSPEQAKGGDVDQSTDTYAFGLILYDMLLGRRRSEQAASAMDELTGRMKAAPPSMRSVDADIPQQLDEIVGRCVDPDSGVRFQTALELQAALDRLDEDGQPLPVLRRFSPLQLAATVLAVVTALVGAWIFVDPPPPPVPREPMSVLVADLANETGNAAFDGTIEEALGIALEEASFLTVYRRTAARDVAEAIGADRALDEETARLVSVREGIDAVLTGSIVRQGTEYETSIRVLDATSDGSDGSPLAVATASAPSDATVLESVVTLAATIRRELGDADPQSEMLASTETFTAGSLEAMRAYARGQELFSTRVTTKRRYARTSGPSMPIRILVAPMPGWRASISTGSSNPRWKPLTTRPCSTSIA